MKQFVAHSKDLPVATFQKLIKGNKFLEIVDELDITLANSKYREKIQEQVNQVNIDRELQKKSINTGAYFVLALEHFENLQGKKKAQFQNSLVSHFGFSLTNGKIEPPVIEHYSTKLKLNFHFQIVQFLINESVVISEAQAIQNKPFDYCKIIKLLNPLAGISWCNCSWNVIAGCSRVNSTCRNCYAFAEHMRQHEIFVQQNGWSQDGTKTLVKQYAIPFNFGVQIYIDRMLKPVQDNVPRTYFVNSWSDLFHEKLVENAPEVILKTLEVIEKTPWHTYFILTKRPQALLKFQKEYGICFPKNVTVSVSVGEAKDVALIDHLRKAGAAYRGISFEPLHGDVTAKNLDLSDIHLALIGGESGCSARKCDPSWVKSLITECVNQNVLVFFKQWGEYKKIKGQPGNSNNPNPKDPTISKFSARRVKNFLHEKGGCQLPEEFLKLANPNAVEPGVLHQEINRRDIYGQLK